MSALLEEAVESGHSRQSQGQPSGKEYLELFERTEREREREQARRQAHAQARELARQQGVKPICNIEDLRSKFWPEEESVDEFLALVRAIRQQDISE
ncbi:MAG TPA: hypothetical protein VGO96_21150 [Pyrinomonadaceae bacterium]|jgi:hypothetical protein|nr:hypothetical protein [Pyrinomonadaceae bacterium]